MDIVIALFAQIMMIEPFEKMLLHNQSQRLYRYCLLQMDIVSMKKRVINNYLLLYITYLITQLTFSGWYSFKPGIENPKLTFIALFFIIGVFFTVKNIQKFAIWMFTD